jgi:hypothetical protein
MALEYASSLTVLDRRSRAPASLPDIAALVGRWAEVDVLPLRDLEAVGRSGGKVVASLLDPGDPNRWAWRLNLDVTSEDQSQELVDWTASVTVYESRLTHVSVQVERTARGPALRPLVTRPMPPLIVRTLLEEPTLLIQDGGTEMVAEVRVLDPAGVSEFVEELLLDPSRALPVIGVSEASTGEVVDVGALSRELLGVAHVSLVTREATWRLSEALTSHLSVYNGVDAALVAWSRADRQRVRAPPVASAHRGTADPRGGSKGRRGRCSHPIPRTAGSTTTRGASPA